MYPAGDRADHGSAPSNCLRLLNDALAEHIVEIRIHDPEADCAELQQALCNRFGLRHAVVCGVSGTGETLCRLMTVKGAIRYLVPALQKGGLNIALSWGGRCKCW